MTMTTSDYLTLLMVSVLFSFTDVSVLTQGTLAADTTTIASNTSTSSISAAASCNRTTQFQCRNSNHGRPCIPVSYVCDGEFDCADKSDEAPAVDCRKYETTLEALIPCGRKEFRCENNEKCISERDLCDGQDECQDRSDESNKICKPFVCNHESLFMCKVTGKCVRKVYLCDGEDDCGGSEDTSDEDGCQNTDNCPPFTFGCPVGPFNTTTCRSEALRCDGIRHCSDARDELNCPPKNSDGTYCESTEFECKNHLCIKYEDICDKTDDCLDEFDELPEICEVKKRLVQLFQRNLQEQDDWSEPEI